jgi:hypothetical protein
MVGKPRQMLPKFSKGNEISMTGTVRIVHGDEYSRPRLAVRLQGYDIPATGSDEHVDLCTNAEPVKTGRRKQPLVEVEAD